jgi:hypothetical protein
MAATQVKEGQLYQERTEGAQYPRVIRVKKITNIGPNPYVYFMAENQRAQSIHPNGGMIPLNTFLEVWTPVKS